MAAKNAERQKTRTRLEVGLTPRLWTAVGESASDRNNRPRRDTRMISITAQLTKAVDYGIHQLSINGQAAGKPIDLFHDGVIPAEPLDLGVFDLKEKDNQLTVEVAGTNEKARPKAYMFGLDYLVLKPQS